MKEALNSPYNKIIFRETFNDDATVRRQGTPTDVTFSNGVGSFNGTSSKVNYNLGLNGTYSVRIKVKNLAYTQTYASLMDFRNSVGADTAGYVYTGSTYGTKSLNASSGTIYVNGVISSTYTGVNDEIVVAGITITSNRTLIGVGWNLTSYRTSGFYDLVEIYEGTLTASEVKNLYENKWNKELSPNNLLLNFDSTQGTIKDRTGKNNLTPTAITIKKIGQSYSADFNGSTSKIDTGSDFIGTKAITACGWFYNKYSVADNKFVRLINNGKLIVQLQISDQLIVRSDGSTALLGKNGLLAKDKWLFITITRASDGTTVIYMGDKDTAPYQDTTGNTGTPTAGTSNVIIGSDGSTNTWLGYIPQISIYEGILSLQDITRAWSSSLNEI